MGKVRIVADEINDISSVHHNYNSTKISAWCKWLRQNVWIKGSYTENLQNQMVYVLQKRNGQCLMGYPAKYYFVSDELKPYIFRPFL